MFVGIGRISKYRSTKQSTSLSVPRNEKWWRQSCWFSFYFFNRKKVKTFLNLYCVVSRDQNGFIVWYQSTLKMNWMDWFSCQILRFSSNRKTFTNRALMIFIIVVIIYRKFSVANIKIFQHRYITFTCYVLQHSYIMRCNIFR